MSAFVGLLVLTPVSSVTNGLGVMWMWRWFVAPLGVPEIGFWHALGLAILASFATIKFAASDFETAKVSEIDRLARFLFVQIVKWFAIGIAAIAWSFTP